jgi:hypothetical protein
MYTLRNDWLTRGLEGLPNTFVSGSPLHSQRLVPTATVTLRMAGHFPPQITPPSDPAERARWLPPFYELMTFFVCVELSTQAAVDSFQYSQHEKLCKFFEWFEGHVAAPVALLAFPGQGFDQNHGMFWIMDRKASIDGLAVPPKDYATTLNQLRNPLPFDEPREVKAINSSINDTFQWWTRTYLTKQLSVNDLDAISWDRATPGKTVIIELKRSSQKGWLPYLNDVPNYMLSKALVRTMPGSVDLTIRYDKDHPYSIDCFSIGSISREVITGGKIALPPEINSERSIVSLAGIIAKWPDLKLTAYSSKNRKT